MSFGQAIYFCSHCKSIHDQLEALYFVEDDSKRGFCSEACIESFYSPIFKYYEKIEVELRKKLGLVAEDFSHYIQDVHLMERILKSPDMIYELENDLEERTYAFLLKVEREGNSRPVWIIVLCLVSDGRPSFLLLVTATESEEFLSVFQFGHQIEDIQDFLSESIDELELPFIDQSVSAEDGTLPEEISEQVEIDMETHDSIEQKKSSVLAELMELRSVADIPYENFHLYHQFMASTLESPDEVYTHLDSAGDRIRTYIKAHDKDGVSFFYFVICYDLGSGVSSSGQAFVPILGFPSLDGELSQRYRHGDKVSGKLKN